MKVLVLMLALGSFSTFANDKVAYVSEKLNSVGTYILCEGNSRKYDSLTKSFYTIDKIENLNNMIAILRESASATFSVSSLDIIDNKACVILNKK